MLAFEELFSYCERALRACEAEGAEHAEAFALSRSTREFGFSLRDREPHTTAYATSRLGLAIRAYAGGRLGFSYTTDLSDEALRQAARSALKAAQPVEGFEGFPSPGQVRPAELFDRELATLPEEELLGMLDNLMRSAGEREKIKVTSASVGVSVVSFCVANTSGLEAGDSGTFVSASVSTLAEGAPSPVQASATRRKLSELQLDRLAEESASLSLLMAKTGSVEPGKADFLLSPWVVAELLAYTFARSLRADNVRLGTSVLKDELGRQVASEAITILDDPTHPGGLCTFGLDDEGWPAERRTLVEKGVLKGFLYDSLEAAVQGVRAGGNCIRWEPPTVDSYYPRDYRFRPSIYPTNLVVAPGSGDRERLTAELGEGIYAYRSLSGFGMSPSGDFSLYITTAFVVRDGQLAGGLRGLTLKGNVFQLLKAAEAVGSDLEPVIPDMAGFCVLAPHLLARGLEIAS